MNSLEQRIKAEITRSHLDEQDFTTSMQTAKLVFPFFADTENCILYTSPNRCISTYVLGGVISVRDKTIHLDCDSFILTFKENLLAEAVKFYKKI